MNLRLRRWQVRPRRLALLATGILVAAGLTTVTATPAFAAVVCQVDYTLRTQWNTGFTADLTLRNAPTSDALNGWTIGFTWPGNQQITQPPWNAGTWSQTGNQVSISNAGWNGNVAPGGTVTGIGFNGSYSGTNTAPTNFTVNGTSCGGPQQPTPQLVVTPTAVSVPEGGTATYAVSLTAAPAANVTVTSTAGTGDNNITVSGGGSLTFTPGNFATPQNVTLAAAQDTDTTNGSRTISVSATGMTPVTVTATEVDDDPVASTLIVTPTAVTVPEGGTATYTVRLSANPTSNVTVTSTAQTGGTNDTNITVSGGGSLTFTPTNGTTPQTVTLAAAQDADAAPGVRTIVVAATGRPSVNVTATEQDDDVTQQSLIVAPTAVTVPEGGTATYTVRLAVNPTANVTVTNTAGAGDTNITVTSGGSLTFTPANGTTPQTVTLAAAQDADSTPGSRTIAVASTGLTTVNVTATEQDDDQGSQALVVSPTTVAVPEGGTNTYAVSLAAQPAANVTVTSTAATGGSNDTNITVSGGASLTFTPANWNVTQNVTLAAAEDADETNGSRTINVTSTGLTSVAVTATEVDNDPTGGDNLYIEEFLEQYNKIKDPASGYFSPEGVPYHSVETLMVEAPDHGHETTSEAYSFYVWLEAMYGRVTEDWTRFNAAWNNLEQFIIPSSGFNQGGYNPSDPADYAPEFNQPSGYPAPLDANIDTGNDPLQAELQSTYGNNAVYAMHWLLDVDNVYGYGQAVSSVANCRDSTPRVVYINTYQRGPQESVWETVPHPSCETFAFGRQNNGGFAPIFVGGDAAQQWRFTAAPDADARAVEATYWALTWATEQGNQSQITASVDKAAKMGDYLRYAFYDKYFKTLGCAATTCATTTGKAGMTGLLGWYFAWGGAMDNAWSWRIGSSHNHGGYQNPLAAWAMSPAGPAALRPRSPTAAADWATSLTRQLQFIRWLQASNGAIAGGATNSWNGNYSARPAGQPQFFGMTYDVDPVYHDPPSNEWFGFQAWGVSRVAEFYAVTGNADAKLILDNWVPWAISETQLGTGSTFSIPSKMAWTGAPAGNFSAATGMPPANPGLSVSILERGTDVGVTAALARTLIHYAARAGSTSGLGLQAKNTAKGLLDRLLMMKDARGVAIPEERGDYNRFDDVWSSGNQQGLFIPSGYSGVMANGNPIQPGSTFLSIRTFLQNDPEWPKVQAYLNGGAAPTFTYHRFWAQADLALALADYGHFFPEG
jgi:hypothetical protein